MKTANRVRLCVEELEGRLVPSTLTYSTNWSGYAVSTSAGAVTQVSGSWVVPAVSPTVSGYSSAWVGIDGWNSSTVEQIGTDSDYVNGQAQYYAWYEMYPAYPVNLSLAIHPGDTISASVSYTGSNQFVLSITDVNTGKSFSTTQTLSQAKRSSAEWIQEAPYSGGVLPLANFGTINFSKASATVNGTTGPADNSWSGSTLYQTNMVTNSGSLKDTTSALSDSGTPPTSSFSVTWVSSGSGSRGRGHKSVNMAPPSDASPTASFVSAAVAELAGHPQGTLPALVATSSPTVAVAPPAGGAVPTLPALTAFNATSVPSGVGAASPDGETADQPNVPELLPAPRESAVPVNPGAAPRTDELPAPQADQTSAKVPGASAAMAPASEASVADGFWLQAAALEGAWSALNEDAEGRDIALAGLVLTLALDRAGASALQGQIGKPSRVRDRFWQNDDR